MQIPFIGLDKEIKKKKEKLFLNIIPIYKQQIKNKSKCMYVYSKIFTSVPPLDESWENSGSLELVAISYSSTSNVANLSDSNESVVSSVSLLSLHISNSRNKYTF